MYVGPARFTRYGLGGLVKHGWTGSADDDVWVHLQYQTREQGTKSQAATTIVLRGANDFMLDEMDRALHDSLMVIKRMLESNALVAGGGAVESALSIHLEKYATTLGSKEQLAIAEFADALLVIPRTLSVNAAQVEVWFGSVWIGIGVGLDDDGMAHPFPSLPFPTNPFNTTRTQPSWWRGCAPRTTRRRRRGTRT